MRSPAEGGRLGVALLGSTGSIGRQAVEVLEQHADRFRVVALATGRNAAELEAQAARLHPAAVALADDGGTLDLPAGTERVRGEDALEILATRADVDIVVIGSGGVVSLRPVLAALRAGKVVATANKETLVAGGHLVMAQARLRAAERAAADPRDPLASPLAWLRPIDSEHSAIWQCLVGEPKAGIARLVLTASGGPFLDATPEELAAVTPAQALKHPTWTMGAKITIDSATLANKGLEVIEAHWLYDVGYDAIDVVVHPQSVVHSAVQFVDGSLKAQLGTPDMRLPIQYALTHPERLPSPDGPAGPRGRGPPRLPRPGRDPLPSAPHRPRCGQDRQPRVGRAHRRRRGRRRPVPGRHAGLHRDPAPPGGCRAPLRRRRRPGTGRRRSSSPWTGRSAPPSRRAR